MSAIETIFSQIESNRKQMIDLQTLLCSIPAIAPESGGEGELKKAEALVDWLKRNSMNEIRMIDAPDKRVPGGRRPNIIVTIPGKKKEGCPSFLTLLLNHVAFNQKWNVPSMP